MENNYYVLKNLDFEEKKIFNLLQKKGKLSKSQISLLTNIKITTLKSLMHSLEKNKIIVKKCIGESTGGRKPKLYDIDLNEFYIIGIDISIMYTQMVITNLKMEILYKDIFYMDSACTSDETVKRIVEIINKAYENLKLNSTKLLGVGLATVGPLDIENGIIKNPTNFYAPKWSNIPIRSMLEEKLNCHVTIENGANAAAVAEYLYGIGKGIENIAYFNHGIGIRTGTISSGSLLRMINDEEEVFGHMIIEANGKQCKCGSIGCIESYSSIKSIIEIISDKIKRGRHTIINKSVKDINYKDICLAAEKDDDLAKEILTDSALMLGIGLANYIKLLNPKLVILSGPLIIESKLFYDVCINNALKNLHSTKGKGVIFNRCGYFKENAMSVGAAAMVIERCLDSKI